MLPEKNALSLEEIDEQSALELPERKLLTLLNIAVDVTKITQTATVVQVNNVGFAPFSQVSQTNYSLVYQGAHV